MNLGLVRVFLALSVVIAHQGIGGVGVDGYYAVLAFFTISGFVIAMVLNEKYQTDTKAFYIARYMRLWPSYMLVFMVTAVFIDPIRTMPVGATIYAYCISATMFLYETLWWIGTNNARETTVFLGNINGEDGYYAITWLTNMPHMWSIGIELMFYAAAPFMARKPKVLLIALLVSYVVHIAITMAVGQHHPLRYRSILNFFWLFTLGMLAYHGWKLLRPKLELMPTVWYAPFICVAVMYLCLVPLINWIPRWMVDMPFILFAALLIPFFHATRSIKWDRQLGELSYPIYLVHWPILTFWLSGHKGSWPWTILIVLATVAASVLIFRFVDKPIERYRRKLVVAS